MQNNPFTMTFDLEPENSIKRIMETDKIISEFTSEKVSNYVYIITGVKGSGKTVLLSNITSYFMNSEDWIVVNPDPKNNTLENIASEIYESTKMKKLFLKGEFSFSFQGHTFSLQGKEPVRTVNILLKKMLGCLKDKGKRVLITIDEVDNSEEMKYFIQAYQSLLRLGYPVFLLMAGLYENVSKLQDDKALNFLYRAPKINLGPLNMPSIAMNYRQYLNVDEETSFKLAALTKGYAYAYQALGYLLFSQGLKDINESVLVEFDHYLADYVYDKLFTELSDKEQKVLMAFEKDNPIKLEDIGYKIKFCVKTLSVYRDKLIKKGIVNSPKYGYLEFSLPRFYEYLRFK